MLRYALPLLLAAYSLPVQAQQQDGIPDNIQRASMIAVLAAELTQDEMRIKELTKERDELREKLTTKEEAKPGG